MDMSMADGKSLVENLSTPQGNPVSERVVEQPPTQGASAESVSSKSVGTQLSPRQFYRHDPVLVLFKDILHLHSSWIVVGVIIFTGGVFFSLATTDEPHFDLQSTLLQALVLFPILAGTYVLLPGSIARLFNTLNTNGAIGEYREDRRGSETFEDFSRKLVAWVDSVWWTVGALVFVGLHALYLFLLDPQFSKHSESPLWLKVAVLAVYLPMLYSIFLSVARLVVTLIFTNWLFHLYTIRVNPLHPDGSAGLSILEHMLTISEVKLTAMGVAALVLLNSSTILRYPNPLSHVEGILLGVTYLVLAPSLLVGWLMVPHRVMKEARNAVLQPLADEFQKAVMQNVPIVMDKPETIKAHTEWLAELKRRYALLEETFPTWPLELMKVRRLVATMTLPAIITVTLPFMRDWISFVTHLLK